MKANKEGIVSLILSELDNLKTYSETKIKVSDKAEISERTFKRYWKIACEQYAEKQIVLRQTLEATKTGEEQKSLLEGIRTKNEHLLQLERMLDDDYTVEEVSVGKLGFITYKRKLTPTEKIKVKEIIGKWQGYNAQTKPTDTETEKHCIITIGGIPLLSE